MEEGTIEKGTVGGGDTQQPVIALYGMIKVFFTWEALSMNAPIQTKILKEAGLFNQLWILSGVEKQTSHFLL